MKRPYLIGLGHKARQGKDTVGGFLAERGFVVLHFADALKAQATRYGWSPDEKNILATELFERNTEKPLAAFVEDGIFQALLSDIEAGVVGGVTFLQWLGSYRRSQDQNYWVNITMRAAIEHLKAGTSVAICDMRYTNEADAISSMDTSVAWPYVVDVVRLKHGVLDGIIGEQYIDPDRDPNHPSEVDLDEYEFDDLLVALDGDLVGLREETENLLEHLEVTFQNEVSE